MNIVIGYVSLFIVGVVFYAMQQGTLLEAFMSIVALSTVGLVWAGVQWNNLNRAQNHLINQRGKFLASKLAFAWALECMAPQEIRPYIQYDAQSIYLRMLDQGLIPNIKMVREMKNYYLNNESQEKWDEYLKRTKKQYLN